MTAVLCESTACVALKKKGGDDFISKVRDITVVNYANKGYWGEQGRNEDTNEEKKKEK